MVFVEHHTHFNVYVSQRSQIQVEDQITDPGAATASRVSKDLTVNNFGNRLVTVCKENNLLTVNGRLESGNYTCYNTVINVLLITISHVYVVWVCLI